MCARRVLVPSLLLLILLAGTKAKAQSAAPTYNPIKAAVEAQAAKESRNPIKAAVEAQAAREGRPGPLRPLAQAGVKPPELMLLFRLVGSPQYQSWSTFVREEKLLGAATELANEIVRLDRNLIANFEECGKTNAWYSPSEHKITFCYELLHLLGALFAQVEKDPARQVQALRGASLFFFLHELGHALVGELDLGITGREEDVADQFATLMLLELGREGEAAVLEAARAFLLLSKLRTEPTPLYDEHALDEQRFFNLMCWIYGASPFQNVHLVADPNLLPPERAKWCGDEVQKMRKGWRTLLKDRLKRPLK